MQKILLSMALLSTVTSEKFETKKHRPSLSEDEPQFWLSKGSRIPWDLTHFEPDQTLKDKDVKHHQELESSLNRIPVSQLRDFKKFSFNKPNVPNLQDRTASVNSQNFNHQSSSIDAPYVLMPFDRSELSKINLDEKKSECNWMRCRRRTQGWRVQEPLYVDEPSWVQVNSESLENPLSKSEPFFVTRGKRSFGSKTTNPLRNNLNNTRSNSDWDLEDKKTNALGKPESTMKGRIKRENSQSFSSRIPILKVIQKRSENEGQRVMEIIERSSSDSDRTGGFKKTSNYLHPRNKHSDILEILEEPFFISRGKKTTLHPSRDSPIEEFYLDQYLEDLQSDLEENNISSETKLNAEGEILNKILNNEMRGKRVMDKNRSGSKRGILEELNLQADPFYVARG